MRLFCESQDVYSQRNNFGIVKILIHITFRQDVGLQKQQITKVFIQKRDK